jgi:lysophospholipase L1-like esterase
MRKHFALAVLAAATLLPALATPAAAREENQNENHGDREGVQLALGDSVPFGFSPLVLAAGKAGNPKNFVGFPEISAKRLELRDVNAACPGETSFGLIDVNGLDNGCRPFRAAFPLHVDYEKAQLDFAIRFLKHQHGVRLVTMMIGANDLFKLQSGCNFVVTCEINGLTATLNGVEANLRLIYGQIRNVAQYTGPLATVTYYAISTDPLVSLAVGLLNARLTTVTAAFNGVVADGFGAFKTAAAPFGGDPCAAGLLIVTAPGHCDVHPSPKGRDLLAGAVVSAVPQLQQEHGQH